MADHNNGTCLRQHTENRTQDGHLGISPMTEIESFKEKRASVGRGASIAKLELRTTPLRSPPCAQLAHPKRKRM
eukprot:6480386-Amphidinium_carterae.1